MAITPWSWTASNGTATAAQTVAAYNALTGKDLTSKFSYRVWNDLVSKVYEVNRALSRSWKSDYATYSATRASRVYDELTEERFNSVRFNTNYPLWRWQYDTGYEGYIGRLDVRGVAGYGDSGADIVYGVYLLELVEKLNVVIGIINGTQATEEAEATSSILLLPEPELVIPHSARFDRLRHKEKLNFGALLRAENLPTLTLHYVIPTAGWRALLESEHLSAMMEGFVYASVTIGSTMRRLPPVGLTQIVRSRSGAQALLRMLSPEVLQADAQASAAVEGSITGLPSSSVEGKFFSRIQSSADAVSKHTKSIGWHHVRVMLEPDASLTQEIKKILEAVGVQKIGSTAGIVKAPSINGFNYFGAAGHLGHNAETTPGVPHLMQLHHDVSSVETAADIHLAQFMESLKAEGILTGPSARAKLEYDHVSTMLRAYMAAVVSGQGEMDKQITGPINAQTDFTVTIHADAVSDFAPSLLWAIEVALAIHSEAHTAKAGHGTYHEQIRILPTGQVHTGRASTFDTIRQDYTLSLLGTLGRSNRQNTMIALGRYGHSVLGDMGQSTPALTESAMTVLLPRASGHLDLEVVRSAEANVSVEHELSALFEYLTDLEVLQASSSFSVAPEGSMDHIIYADLAAITRAILILSGDIESEGGRWQYPVIIDTDAAIFQVWLTEQNREHLFLDPHNGIHHAEITSGVNGTIDRQIRIGAASESNHRLSAYGELHQRQRGNWEYPVLDDGVLLITQAIDAKPAYQYKLEVN